MMHSSIYWMLLSWNLEWVLDRKKEEESSVGCPAVYFLDHLAGKKSECI